MSLKRTRTTNPHRVTKSATRQRTGRKNRNAMVSVPRNKLGFPQSMRTKLRYVDRLDFAPTSTTPIVSTFRGNGMYDPLFDTGGHQPRGFDDYMDIYGTFTVVSSTLTLNVMYEGYFGPGTTDTLGALQNSVMSMSPSSTPGAPALSPACVFIRKCVGPDTISTGGFQKVLETDRTQWTFITGSGESKILKSKGNTKAFFGKEAQIGADGYTGTENSDPTNQWYYQVGVARMSDDYPSGDCKVSVIATVEYDCVFTEPKPLAAS